MPHEQHALQRFAPPPAAFDPHKGIALYERLAAAALIASGVRHGEG